MVEKCSSILREAGVGVIDLHPVSGCLEMPLAARRLARLGKEYEAIITFGVVLKGETYHFEMIVDECIRGLGTVMLEDDIPIIVEVLPVTNLDQAKARSANDGFNKGIEAALATIETVAWRRNHPSLHR